MDALAEASTRQMLTLPPQRTYEKGTVTSVDLNTGLVTYTVDDVEHEALTISGFMPSVGQAVQVAVNGNDRLVLPPAGVDPSLYGTIQTGEGPHVNPNTLEDAINVVDFDASFGVVTWQFDATTESWASPAGGLTLSHDATTGQNEGGGGGVVGSLKAVATKSGNVYCYSPTVTVLRDADLMTLASAWIRASSAGSEDRYAQIEIQWYDSTGTTLEKTSVGPQVHDFNATLWASIDTSDFGPANPASNKARIVVRFYNVFVGDVFYIDNGLIMAPTNSVLSLNDPAPAILDDFNRADNTNVSTGSPLVWTERSGDWSIASNMLRLLTHTGGWTGNVNGITTNLPSGTYTNRHNVRLTATVATSADGWGIAWRYSAANSHWRLISLPGFGQIRITKIVAGVATDVVTVTGLLEVGDVVVVELDEQYHRIYVNGNLIGNITDTALQTNVEHGICATSVTTPRWENFTIEPGDAIYLHGDHTTSLEVKSLAAGTTFARTPATLDIQELPVVRKGEYWIVDAYCKQRRTNGTDPKLYLFAMTVYDEEGNFLANDFGGGFGPGGVAASAWNWQYMVSAFQIRHPLAARARVNLVFLASAADQRMYVSELFVRKASVVTAPILRTAAAGPRIETLPTPTGPQLRVFKGTADDGYSHMLHGFVGRITGNTDANGRITFSHGLKNVTPLAVIVQTESPDSGTSIPSSAIVDTIGVATARARFIGHNDVAYASAAITFRFIAVVAI